MSISIRTFQRWTKSQGVSRDQRKNAKRPPPVNSLTQRERQKVLEVINSEPFKDLPPSQIVPTLADQGEYIASESTFYRIMRDEDQLKHRGHSREPKARPISTHYAKAPNQLWCWDISWLQGPVRGAYFYLYLILDIFSRKIVGWEIHENESGEHASELILKAHRREGVGQMPLVLHSDNGGPMKGATMLSTLYDLGVTSSFNRPRVSNDNAYAESIFKTCKYRPAYPRSGFKDIGEARQWMMKFVHWYNHHHKHSGLKFLSPVQRHQGLDAEIMGKRKEVYEMAKAKNPERWSGSIRNWDLDEIVYLNPEKLDVHSKAKY